MADLNLLQRYVFSIIQRLGPIEERIELGLPRLRDQFRFWSNTQSWQLSEYLNRYFNVFQFLIALRDSELVDMYSTVVSYLVLQEFGETFQLDFRLILDIRAYFHAFENEILSYINTQRNRHLTRSSLTERFFQNESENEDQPDNRKNASSMILGGKRKRR